MTEAAGSVRQVLSGLLAVSFFFLSWTTFQVSEEQTTAEAGRAEQIAPARFPLRDHTADRNHLILSSRLAGVPLLRLLSLRVHFS